MAYVQNRVATTGELIRGTFDLLAVSRREVGLYALVFAGLGAILGVAPGGGVIFALGFLLFFPAQFWLCRKMLIRCGIQYDSRFRVFSFFAMAIILGLAIMTGFNFFWIPGILLGAKWVMAPAYLVAQEGKLFGAIGNAWRASEGNTLSLSLAYTAVAIMGLIPFWGAAIATSAIEYAISDAGSIVSGPLSGAILSLSINAIPIMLMALSVAAYRLLSGEIEDLTAVFE